jgi:hypothetical protein
MEASLALINIITPSDSDVICGRGFGSNHRKGNESFRRIVKEMKDIYKETEGQTPKADIARKIISWIRYEQDPPGRFLNATENRMWKEIGDKKTQVKTSQALRENGSNPPSDQQKKIEETNQSTKEYSVTCPEGHENAL